MAFIRAQIELVTDLFTACEVDEIWITFPDPQIKFKRDETPAYQYPIFSQIQINT